MYRALHIFVKQVRNFDPNFFYSRQWANWKSKFKMSFGGFYVFNLSTHFYTALPSQYLLSLLLSLTNTIRSKSKSKSKSTARSHPQPNPTQISTDGETSRLVHTFPACLNTAHKTCRSTLCLQTSLTSSHPDTIQSHPIHLLHHGATSIRRWFSSSNRSSLRKDAPL